MNIGIFTDTYFPQISGVATSVKMLEKELNALGHKVFIFTTTDPEVTMPSSRIFRIKSMPFVFFPSRRLAYYYSPKLLMKMKDFKLDIIHTQTEFSLGFFGKYISGILDIPLIHTYHTMYEDYVHYIANGHLVTPKMAQSFSKYFCNGADRVITPVEKSKKSLLKYGVIKPIEVIPTGLEFSKYEKNRYTEEEILETKKELGLNPNDPIVLSLGRISKEKSVDIVVNQMPKLLEKIPNAKLVIVGDGPMIEGIKLQVKNMNLENSVIIAGSRPWEEIGRYYQLGDIFVSASSSETQGLTYIEAMIGEVPLVIKKDESFEGVVVDGENGYVFEEDEDFAEVAYKALSNKEKATELATNGYKSVENLSAVKFARELEKVYTETIKEYIASPSVFKNVSEKIKVIVKRNVQ